MDPNRRRILTGLITAPAVLKLGLHMPVKPVIELIERPSLVLIRQRDAVVRFMEATRDEWRSLKVIHNNKSDHPLTREAIRRLNPTFKMLDDIDKMMPKG